MSLLAGSDALPFWIDDSLSWTTVLYTALLTLFGAAIVGILPALRVTKINVQDALRSESAARLRAPIWWFLDHGDRRAGRDHRRIPPARRRWRVRVQPLPAESGRYRCRAIPDRTASAWTAKITGLIRPRLLRARALSFDELERRLGAEPGVERVTFADRLPVEDQFKYQIEVDTTTGAPATGLRTSTLVQVSRGFFAAFGTSVVAGRDFEPLDFETGRVMIVNESFARHVFGDRNPIGQRIRIVSGEIDSVAGEEWYEVVGMVKDFGWQLPRPQEQSAMYRPRLPTAGAGVSLAVRVRDPEAFATRLRTVAADVDPTIRLTDVQPLAQVGGGEATDQLGADLGCLADLVHRVAALGDRHPFADVVHRRATDARDRHSRRARCEPGTHRGRHLLARVPADQRGRPRRQWTGCAAGPRIDARRCCCSLPRTASCWSSDSRRARCR